MSFNNRDYQRDWARRKRKSHDVAFKAKDAERQRKRRRAIDPNIAREYARERRFRFTRSYEKLKLMGFSITTDLQLRAGLFTFVLRGVRVRERFETPDQMVKRLKLDNDTPSRTPDSL